MDIGKAIFLGLALIALAIFATDAMRPAQAGDHQNGRYNISSGHGSVAYIIDTRTGRYRRCDYYKEKCGAWRSSQ